MSTIFNKASTIVAANLQPNALGSDKQQGKKLQDWLEDLSQQKRVPKEQDWRELYKRIT